MNDIEAKERIKELRATLEYHAKKYYDEDKPEITDYEYDMMMNELKSLEKQFPELIDKESLTQKVGGHVKEGFKQVEHEVPLQSLQDVFSYDELRDFDDRVKKQLHDGGANLKYVVETKIDGLSMAIEYKDGKFVRAATRGNGLIGEDVSANALTIKSIPKELKEPINIIVRGEVFIGSKEFEKLKKDGRILIDKFVPFQELQYKIGEVDLNIIPLQNHEFNHCKSELKYFEASIVDVVSCATDNNVYHNIIEDGKDGFLCTEMDWYDKIEYVYLNYDKMKNVIKSAKKKCYQLYGNNRQEERILNLYDDIIESIGGDNETK